MPISGAAANNIAQCFLHLSSFHSTQNQILSPMMNDFISLPQELHIQILSHLDAISLTQCAMTCKYMYETLQITSQLLCIIQLHFEGVKDAGTSTSHSELIAHLQRHREAWLSPNLIGEREYIAIDMKYQFEEWELVGGAFADMDSQHFEIVSLPTSSDKETRTPRGTELGMRMRDFKMDPTRDVIAFLEDYSNPSSPTTPRVFRIHIRTISTNAIHPLARQSPLQIQMPLNDNVYNRTVVFDLARDIVVLYVCTFEQDSARPYIQIWDWTTSDVLVDFFLPFDRSISARPYEFGLIDSTYCFITDTFGSGSIRLYKLVRSPSAAHAPIHLATLYFPPIADDSVRVLAISAHTIPIASNPLPHVPFLLNDDDRLHVFMLQYVYDAGSSVLLNMFVHQRVLARYCTPRADGGDMPLEIPWEEWGPIHTRFFHPEDIQRHLLKYVYGQRAVWTRPETDTIEPPDTIEVLDFSLAAVLSVKNNFPLSPLLENGKCRTLVASSTIHTGQPPFFKHDVVTHLPCVSTEWSLKQAYSMYLIYEYGIIGVDMGRSVRGVSMLFH
ncbi:hypothetical protein BJ912DRAFT_1149565 [Pholiota molesta]|nr:hypothetical protein BJ912DRAFT_1149565 [Pholiota molesta]